ncbi:MAG: NUDIX domain-containing protein [Chloroflexota bacterium]|nr:NUDIX domain-containing protein [Chloroflexota bacterium]
MTDVRDKCDLTVGGIVLCGDTVLLVRHRYGPTQGRWDFPRGYVRADEDLEAAVMREVTEETGVKARPVRIVAVRNQMRAVPGVGWRNDVLIVWLLHYLSGDPTPDGGEVSETAFLGLDEAADASEVTSWTRDLLRAVPFRSGLVESDYRPRRLPDGVTYWKCFE